MEALIFLATNVALKRSLKEKVVITTKYLEMVENRLRHLENYQQLPEYIEAKEAYDDAVLTMKRLDDLCLGR